MVQQELRGDGDGSEKCVTKEQEEARILLIGDCGAGKTSLIYSLVNDEFESSLPARMADITIPAEATPERVPVQIVDYSSRDQSEEELDDEIKNATVICIVYDASDDEGLDRVATYWIPIVRKSRKERRTYKPIILIANKIDLIEEYMSLDKVSVIIHKFVDIEAFIEVSALSQKNVVELFASAQKAITYPLAPLFDPQLRILTKKCQSALMDIFTLSDFDGDGLLNDHELNLFQENCFGTPLQKDALDDLKLIIQQSTIDGIVNDGLTQAGFLFLHALSIDKGRLDFTWQVLRKFNYDNEVNAREDQPLDETPETFEISSQSLLNRIRERVDNFSETHSESSSTNEDADDYEDSSRPRLDVAWIRQNQNIFKLGIGLSILTLLSFLTLRRFIRGSLRDQL